MQQIPHRGAMIRRRQSVQIGEREAAPGRAQNGEPRDAIGRVQQREGQRHQVFDHLPLAELIDLDGLECNSIAASAR